MDILKYAIARKVNGGGSGGSSGGSTPMLGFVPTEWDSNGRATKGIHYGTTIPNRLYCIPDPSYRTHCYFQNLSDVEFVDTITDIGEGAFNNNIAIQLKALPNTVKSIGANAFSGCKKLALTELPEGLTAIPNRAFYYCNEIKLTSLPKNIASIGNSAFAACTSITSLTFKGTPTSIAYDAFSSCTNLITINVPWAEGAVSGAPWGATKATINYNYTGE